MADLPKTSRCVQCGEWYHNAHCCPANLQQQQPITTAQGDERRALIALVQNKSASAKRGHEEAAAAFVTYEGTAADLNELSRYVRSLETAIVSKVYPVMHETAHKSVNNLKSPQPVSVEVSDLLFEIDDWVARLTGNDRGSYEPINQLRAILALAGGESKGVASEKQCDECGIKFGYHDSRCSHAYELAGSTDDDDPIQKCDVCGGGLRYGSRHHQCGSAIIAAVKQALAAPQPSQGAADSIEPKDDVYTAVLSLDTFRPVRLEFGVTMHRDVIPNDAGWIRREDVLSAIAAPPQPVSAEAGKVRLRIAIDSFKALRDSLLPAFAMRGVSLRVSQEDHEAIRSALAGASTGIHLLEALASPSESVAVSATHSALPAQAVGEKPVAWLRNLTDPQPHAVTDLKYRTAADADAGVEYVPVFAAPMPQPEPTSKGEEGPIREGWTVSYSANGHSGPGVYAYMDEYPEEGAILLHLIEGDKRTEREQFKALMQSKKEDIEEGTNPDNGYTFFRDTDTEYMWRGWLYRSNLQSSQQREPQEAVRQAIKDGCEEYDRNLKNPLSAPQEASKPARCPNCDDTGDVHSLDGEWRARCWCPAGQLGPLQNTASKEASKVEPVADSPFAWANKYGSLTTRPDVADAWAKDFGEDAVLPLYAHPSPQALSDEEIAKAVRPLYSSDEAAAMGFIDDVRTARAIQAAMKRAK